MKEFINTKKKTLVYGGFLIIASIVANFFNYVFNAYLGRVVSLEIFGVISLIGSILSLTDVPISSLSRTVTYKSAYVFGKYQQTIETFWKIIRKRSLFVSCAITVAWIIAVPFLSHFFDTDSFLPFLLFTPVWTISMLLAIDTGYLNGNLKFAVLAVMTSVEAISKLLFAVLFVVLHQEQYIYAALPLSMLASLIVAQFSIKKIPHNEGKKLDTSLTKFPKQFYMTSVMNKISAVAFLSFDLIMAKHFLSQQHAGEYALLSLSGKMIFFGGSLFSQFITPIVSKEEGAGRSSEKVFYQLLAATATTCLIGFIIIGAFGWITIPLLFGAKANDILAFLPLYTFAMVLFTVANTIVSYHQIKKNDMFPITGLLFAVLEIVGISFYHHSIQSIVLVMFIISLISLVFMFILHFIYPQIKFAFRNVIDLFGLFSPVAQTKKISKGKLRVLIFNWRDTKHKWHGGSEAYVHEIAKQWVKKGDSVTIFCGNDGNCPRYEMIDGVQVIRRGGFYTVYIWAFLYYILRFRNTFDVIVDSENGIPFFSPLYARIPVFLLIHHVHQEVFRDHLRWPLSFIARTIEAKFMPFVYRNAKIITISDSSKEDIEKIGLGKKSDIAIIHPGIVRATTKNIRKTEHPTLLYLGRLKPYKKVDVALRAFAAISKEYPHARFSIVGNGESMSTLQALAKELKITKKVFFLGEVSESTKRELFAKSWVMVQPSQIEGWGITVIEANSFGTPVIASNVKGLRDSVINGKTGLLAHFNNVKAFAQSIDLLFSNTVYLKMLEKESYIWSKSFGWEKSAEKFYDVIIENIVVKSVQPIRKLVLSQEVV